MRYLLLLPKGANIVECSKSSGAVFSQIPGGYAGFLACFPALLYNAPGQECKEDKPHKPKHCNHGAKKQECEKPCQKGKPK